MGLPILPLTALLTGIIGLLWGADRFIFGSAGAARNLGVTPLVIGLTVISVGTSAPEIIVSINAALEGAPGLAIGNALGSNLANIGLVLGITALVAPLPVQHHLLRHEGPALLIVTLLSGLCLYNAYLGRWESLALMALFFPLLYATFKSKSMQPRGEQISEGEEIPEISNAAAIFWAILGLAVLLASARITVWGATTIATDMGVSELVIGLTVVAVGTSLPELAASVVSALRGHHEIALGNVIGSNLFNILLVMTAAGAIAPAAFDTAVFSRDYLSMLAMTLIMMAMIWLALRNGDRRGVRSLIPRWAGAVLLLSYGLYYALLIPALT